MFATQFSEIYYSSTLVFISYKLFMFNSVLFFAGEKRFLITQGGLSAEARCTTDSIPEWNHTAVRGVLRP